MCSVCYITGIQYFSGADGSRTRVQTRKQYAFYMLIFAFGFRLSARPKPPTDSLSAKNFEVASQPDAIYLRYSLHLFAKPPRGAAFERCLVAAPVPQLRLKYYTSV